MIKVDDFTDGINQESCELLASLYIEQVQLLWEAATNRVGLRFPKHGYLISHEALSQALAHAHKDLQGLALRRKIKTKISPAKIAGILNYRLARLRPVYLQGGKLCEDEGAIRFNCFVATYFVFKYVLDMKYQSLPPTLRRELNYAISKRHPDQELLSLFYEAILCCAPCKGRKKSKKP